MKFLPFENFYIITNLKTTEVQEQLEKEIEPRRSFSFKNLFNSASGYYFSGYAVNGVFEFKRIINYRNSFLPIIKGATEAYLNGSRIHVKMRMHILVIVFICVWLSGAALGGIAFYCQETSNGRFGFINFAGFAMFLFGYGITMGGFKYESSKAKNKLIDMFNAEIEK